MSYLIQRRRTKGNLDLGRQKLRTLVGLFTSYCSLGYHLFKMGRVSNKAFTLCFQEDETTEYIPYEYQSIAEDTQGCV